MRRSFVVPLALCAVLTVTACLDDQPLPTEAPIEDAQAPRLRGQEMVRVILELPSTAQSPAAQARVREAGGRVLRSYEHFPLLAVEVGANALQGLLRAGGIVSVIEDEPVPYHLDSTLPVINADDVHDLGRDGSGFAVAILDTGIDGDHPFFGGRVVSEACYSSNGTDETPLCPGGVTSLTGAGAASIDVAACTWSGANRCDHGSHVAGIAAGNGAGVLGAPEAGVAPAANIIAIQVFTRFETAGQCSPRPAPCILSYPSDQIAGLNRVITLAGSMNIAAANMSLGGGNNAAACDGDSRKAAIDALAALDIATVISAGNNGFLASVGAPGCISTAVTIGATTDGDAIAGFSNRGTLLDLFAPGVGVISSEDNGTFGSKDGTSMAAPHVTGAWAVLRQESPGSSVNDILTLLQNTGVPIVDGNGVTRSRIDLLAALQGLNTPPTIDVDQAAVSTDEGSTATNTGTYSDDGAVTLTASIGTVVDEGGGVWSWSYDAVDGPAESQTVTVTATDDAALEDDVTFDLTVDNVTPTVGFDAAQVTALDEGGNLAVMGTFSDPGILDGPFSATITCWDNAFGTETAAATVTVTDPSGLSGTVTGTCPYGDTSGGGTFTLTVEVTDKDGATGSASTNISVANVDPTPVIDESGTTLVNGVPTVIAQIGDPVDFSADVTDPGSDDLTVTWDWDDGTMDMATYLLNDPLPDPFPSPSVDPRDITDALQHTFTSACFLTVSVTADDDDGGSDSDEIAVIIGGDSGMARGSGYWLTHYRGRPSNDLDAATLDCYLEIVGFMSSVFDELRDGTSSHDAAEDVLFVAGNNGSAEELLDEQLMAAWLNFANGAFAYDDLVDTDADGVPDTAFSAAVAAAEAVRANPLSTNQQLEEQKDILESINQMSGT